MNHDADILSAQQAFVHWTAHSTTNPADLSDGIQRAKERQRWFIQLMQENPAAALDQAMSRSARAQLPPEIQPYIEQRQNANASLGLSWETHTNHSHNCNGHNILAIDESHWQAHYSDQRAPQDPRTGVPIQAITLQGQALIASSAIEPLTNTAEIAYARQHYPVAPTGAKDPISGNTADHGITALLNGAVYQFESHETIAQAESLIQQQLQAARQQRLATANLSFTWLTDASGGAATSDQLEATPYLGNQLNILFIRVDFEELPGEPISKADLEATLASTNTRIMANSYNQAAITYTVTDQVYRLDYKTATEYAADDDTYGMQLDATTLAREDYTMGDYDAIGLYFADMSSLPGSQFEFAGKASIGVVSSPFYTTGIWINGVNDTDLFMHEFGHNYGARHANYWHRAQTLPGSYTDDSLEYGDIFDVMGKGDGIEAHMNPYTKHRLKWIPDSKVTTINADDTYRVYRFDHDDALNSNALALRISIGTDAYYWVGLRQAIDNPLYNLQRAAYVVAEGFHGEDESNLIDLTPGSGVSDTLDRQDSALEIGETFYDAAHGVTLTTIATGGIAPYEWIDVAITFESSIAMQDATIEIDEQAGVAFATVLRNKSANGAVTVDYATANDTATAGADYYATNGTIVWDNGDSSAKTIAIPIRPDTVAEGIESFTVNLSNAQDAVIDPAANVSTISLLEQGDAYNWTAGLHGGWFKDIAFDTNGKLYTVGDFDGFGDTAHLSGIVRFNPDGSIDNSFVSTTGFNRGVVNKVRILNDGRIIAVGTFSEYNGISCARIACIHPDGSLDTDFQANTGTGANNTIYSIVVEEAGTIVIAGLFTTFNDVSVDKIIRLNPDGTAASNDIDPYFSILSAGYIYDLKPNSNGGFMAAGYQIYKSSSPYQSGILSINADGSRDTNFTITRGAAQTTSHNSIASVLSVEATERGQYYIGGNFFYYNEIAIKYLARINADSTLDTNFTPPDFAYSPGGGVRIDSIYPQIDGKVIIAGRFDSPANCIVRLNSDGSVDDSFDSGDGFDRSVVRLLHDDTGALFCAGLQFHYAGVDSDDLTKVASGVSAYDRWAVETFSGAQTAAGLAGPNADADGDGIRNITEMALGTSAIDPAVGASTWLNAFEFNDDLTNTTALELTYNKTGNIPGTWIMAQFSDDLVHWEPVSPTPNANSTYDIIEDNDSRIQFKDKTTIDGTQKRFGRIVFGIPQ